MNIVECGAANWSMYYNDSSLDPDNKLVTAIPWSY